MARTTVEDCLEHIPNRYELVMLAAKRARQLATGVVQPAVEDDRETSGGIFEKASVLALREIGEGLVNPDDIGLADEVSSEPTQLDFESILRGFDEADRELAEQEGEETTSQAEVAEPKDQNPEEEK